MYYPKSQIQENLSSNGELIYKFSREPYYGFYYKISSGKYFTGKTSQDGPNEELTIKINSNSLLPINENSKVPIYYQNTPTEQDYQNGTFPRYFCKKANELIYIEIFKDTFGKLTNKDPNIYWQLYVPFQINWKLTGSQEDVFRVNRNIVEIVMNRNKLYKFDDYLKKDYLKFW
jgi:hypothetical protein